MKASVTASSQPVAVVRRNSHSRYQYKKVLDGRKQPIRGLWERNGKFIARIARYLLGEIERLGKAKDLATVAPLAAALTEEILNAPPAPFGMPFAQTAA